MELEQEIVFNVQARDNLVNYGYDLNIDFKDHNIGAGKTWLL